MSTEQELSSSSTLTTFPYYKDYTLSISASLNGVQSPVYSFNMRVLNPCNNSDFNWIVIPGTTLPTVTYKINSDEMVIDNLWAQFSVKESLCGSHKITVDSGAWGGGIRYEQGLLKIYTSDDSYAGQTKNVKIYPSFVDYPTQSFHSPSETFLASTLAITLPIYAKPCPVTHITKPVLFDKTYVYGADAIEIGFDEFESDVDPDCNYVWSYSINIDGDDSGIEYDLQKRTITIEASSGFNTTSTLELKGQLSNGRTQDSTSFKVDFIKPASLPETVIGANVIANETAAEEDIVDEEEAVGEDEAATEEREYVEGEVFDWRTAF